VFPSLEPEVPAVSCRLWNRKFQKCSCRWNRKFQQRVPVLGTGNSSNVPVFRTASFSSVLPSLEPQVSAVCSLLWSGKFQQCVHEHLIPGSYPELVNTFTIHSSVLRDETRGN
jgi:hypothetical protein